MEIEISELATRSYTIQEIIEYSPILQRLCSRNKSPLYIYYFNVLWRCLFKGVCVLTLWGCDIAVD